MSGARRIYVIGIGTSFHAAQMGEWLLRAAGRDARAVSSFDFALYPETYPIAADDAVIVMAHSGVKTYSTRSLERATAAGAVRISIGSLTAEHPGSQQVLRTVEREKSAAFTASHLGAMTVLAQIACALGAPFRTDLQQLPDHVASVLSRQSEVTPVAHDAANRRIYAAGAGPNAISATEAVIKVREAAQGWIDGLPSEQFLHGPLVAVNAQDVAVVIHVPGAAAERSAEIARVLEAIGANLWLVGQAVPNLTSRVFELPQLPEILSPLLTVVPMQMLAYELAVVRGIHPDLFRRDDPKYAAALQLLKL